jgi:hypothetical protein
MGTAGPLKKALRVISEVYRTELERGRTAQGISTDKQLKIPRHSWLSLLFLKKIGKFEKIRGLDSNFYIIYNGKHQGMFSRSLAISSNLEKKVF